MKRAIALAFGVLLFGISSTADARTNAGCLQKQLATTIQGSKMMVRCYGQAERMGGPIDNSCLERAARRMRVTFDRMAAAGCAPVEDSEQIISETIGFMDTVVAILSKSAESAPPSPGVSPARPAPTPTPTPVSR